MCGCGCEGERPSPSGTRGLPRGWRTVLADQALAVSERPSLGLLNAVYGKAQAAALRGDRATAPALDAQGRHIFDTAGTHERRDRSFPAKR